MRRNEAGKDSRPPLFPRSQGNTTGNGLGGGVYVDPSATATANTQTLIAGNQASKSNNDVWGTITIGP
jgi:hypothetical protein